MSARGYSYRLFQIRFLCAMVIWRASNSDQSLFCCSKIVCLVSVLITRTVQILTRKLCFVMFFLFHILLRLYLKSYLDQLSPAAVRDISISGYIFSCDVIGPDQIKTKQVWPRETGTSYEAIRKFCQAAILKYTKHIQY